MRERPAAGADRLRPSRYSAFTACTAQEATGSFHAARADLAVRPITLTGVLDKAFCTGGGVELRAGAGDHGPSAGSRSAVRSSCG
ncbi:enoyl-CoA hydratase-related protein [Pseudonocardia sp. RS010]|uniref:enoyl-CoA hydratase-related protein n=1 Tax=Pseudonocardia sp. RS010 TaxID=3385979 RepID=UPI0039A3D56D